MKKNNQGKAGKTRVLCPECKEKSAGKIKYKPEDDNSHESYYCAVCKEQWGTWEVKVEKYNTAVFRGSDGEYKFIALTDERKKKLALESQMWKHPHNIRDEAGRYKTTKLSRKDNNLLKRLRK